MTKKFYTKWVKIDEKRFYTQWCYEEDGIEYPISVPSTGEKLDKEYTG